MTTKLCHILAIEKQTKTTSEQDFTALYHLFQKDTLFSGVTRVFAPLNEDGEKFPDEKQTVQQRVQALLKRMSEIASPLFDLAATKDSANCSARADVVVDGIVVLRNLPAVTLLYLEKQLVGIHTVIGKLPELPQTDTWVFDSNSDSYRTEPTQTVKTKKVPAAFIKYPATKEHPAQVDVVNDDIVQGYWTTTKFSGALPVEKKRQLQERAQKLLAAVKFARETANQADAPNVSVAKEVFGYLFAT